MNPSEPPPSAPSAPAGWNQNPKIRLAIQVFQLALLGVLLVQVRVERERTESVVRKAFLERHDLEEQVRELQAALRAAEARAVGPSGAPAAPAVP